MRRLSRLAYCRLALISFFVISFFPRLYCQSNKEFFVIGKISQYRENTDNGYVTFRTFDLRGRLKDTSIKINAHGEFNAVLVQPFEGDIAMMYRGGFILLYMTDRDTIKVRINEKEYQAEAFDISSADFDGKNANLTVLINMFLRKKQSHHFSFEIPWYDKKLTDKKVGQLAMKRMEEEKAFVNTYGTSTNWDSRFIIWAQNEVIYSIAATLCFESATTARHKSLTIEELFEILNPIQINNSSALSNSSYYRFLYFLLGDIQIFANINSLYKKKLTENGNNELPICFAAINSHVEGIAKELLYYYLYCSSGISRRLPYEQEFLENVKSGFLVEAMREADNTRQISSFDITQRLAESNVDMVTKRRLVNIFKDRKREHLLVVFWASWCSPCMKEFPLYPSLADSLSGLKIQFLFLSQQTSDSIVNKMKIRYAKVGEFINLSGNEIKTLNNILNFSSIPQHFLFDTDSKLIAEFQIGRIGSDHVDENVVRMFRNSIKKKN